MTHYCLPVVFKGKLCHRDNSKRCVHCSELHVKKLKGFQNCTRCVGVAAFTAELSARLRRLSLDIIKYLESLG